jgi:transcriptional regulator with XRE-family HTH domain
MMIRTPARRALKSYIESKRGLNQSQLARKLGISQPSVWAWLVGASRLEEPRRRVLERITGIPADDWLTTKERELLARFSSQTDAA